MSYLKCSKPRKNYKMNRNLRTENLLEFFLVSVYIYILTISLFPLRLDECFDCNLYEGLADNLWKGVGFVDTIRNDFILPSIGYPLYILFSKYVLDLDPTLFMKLTIYLGFSFLYFSIKLLNFKGIYIILILHLCLYIIDVQEYYEYSIEPSLFLSYTQLLFFGLLYYRKNSKFNMLLLAFSLLLNILIRPVLYPLILIIIIVSIVLILFRKIKTKSIRLLHPIFLFFAFYLICLGYSHYKYSDSRLATGTYSDIPLYCANNKYIALDRIYYSTLWGKVPTDSLSIAIDPIKLKSKWQDRSSLIKKKVIEFIANDFASFWKGFQWRFSKFTYFQDNNGGYYLFRIWLFLMFLSVLKFQNNDKSLIILSMNLFYLIFISLTSLFPYSGIRYTLPCNLVLLITVLIIIKNIDEKKYITN